MAVFVDDGPVVSSLQRSTSDDDVVLWEKRRNKRRKEKEVRTSSFDERGKAENGKKLTWPCRPLVMMVFS